MQKRLVACLALLVWGAVGWLLFDMWQNYRDGIRLSGAAPSPKVENGWAYDKGVLKVDADTTLVVPDDARIERGSPTGQVEIYLEKDMHFGGHPGGSMSIRQVRKDMGCAYRSGAGKVVLATYGEWDSMIEGGTSINLLIQIPDGLQVERRAGLSGPIRARRSGKQPPNRDEVKPGENGWKAIKDESDRKQTASTRS